MDEEVNGWLSVSPAPTEKTIYEFTAKPCSSNSRFPLVLLIAVEPMFLEYCVESKISSPSRFCFFFFLVNSRFCFVCSNIIDDLSGLSSHNT